jgi:carbon-monoxide dehydrogenase medium subunit
VIASEAARLLQDTELDDQAIEAAAAHASRQEIHPFGNIHASVEYQRHLANVLTKKALKIAVTRAGEGDR